MIIHMKRSHDHAIACALVYVSTRYIRTSYIYTHHTSYSSCLRIMPRALHSYNRFAHVRNYVHVNRMEVPEWKIRMENRMEV